jgi:hypothetical protein
VAHIKGKVSCQVKTFWFQRFAVRKLSILTSDEKFDEGTESRKKKRYSRSINACTNNGHANRPNFDSQDVTFAATSSKERISKDICICDSGASGHYSMSIDGMFNILDIDEKVTVGNGEKMVATKIRSLRRRIIQVDGSTLYIVINDVKFLPELCDNLFSVNKALKNAFKLSNKNENTSLTKDSACITFDRIIKSLDGTIQESR